MENPRAYDPAPASAPVEPAKPANEVPVVVDSPPPVERIAPAEGLTDDDRRAKLEAGLDAIVEVLRAEKLSQQEYRSESKALINLLGTVTIDDVCNWTLAQTDYTIVDPAMRHHFLVRDKPFLNQIWLESVLADVHTTMNIKTLHDPRTNEELIYSLNAWSLIVTRLHLTIAKHRAFASGSPIWTLLGDMDDKGIQSTLLDPRSAFPDTKSDVARRIETALAHAKQSHFLPGVTQLRAVMLAFHDWWIRFEDLFVHDKLLFEKFSCLYGQALSFPVGITRAKFNAYAGKDLSGLRSALVKICDDYHVEFPKDGSIPIEDNARTEVQAWYRHEEIPNKFKYEIKIYVHYGAGVTCLNTTKHDVYHLKSKLPKAVLAVADEMMKTWNDKRTLVSWLISFGIAVFLFAWLWRIWKDYSKAKGRDFWKKLMDNKAQAKHKKRTSLMVTCVYVLGSILTVVSLLGSGVKTSHSLASATSSFAALFGKTDTSVRDMFTEDEEEEEEEDDDDEDEKKKVRKVIIKKKHKAHTAAYFPEVIEHIVNAQNRSHAGGDKPPDHIDFQIDPPLWFDPGCRSKWQIVTFPIWFVICCVRYAVLMTFKHIKKAFMTGLMSMFTFYAGLGPIVQICVFFTVITVVLLFMAWLCYVLYRWIRRRRNNNVVNSKKNNDSRTHRVLEEGAELTRRYLSDDFDATWVLKYAQYVQAKKRLALPLSDEESAFCKLHDVNAMTSPNRSEAGPRRNNNKQRRREGQVSGEPTDNVLDDYDADEDYFREREAREDRDDPDQQSYRLEDEYRSAQRAMAEKQRRERESLQQHYGKNRVNPKSRPPGNRAEGVVKGVKCEPALIPAIVVAKIKALLESLQREGHRGFPLPNWSAYVSSPKAYYSDMMKLHDWLEAKQVRLTYSECPICQHTSVFNNVCRLNHVSILSRPESVPNRVEAMTFAHPRKVGHAEKASSCCVIAAGGLVANGFKIMEGGDGYIIANAHAIANNEVIEVSFPGSAPVDVPTAGHLVLMRDGKPTDVVKIRCPKGLSHVPSLKVTSVAQPERMGNISVLQLRKKGKALINPYFDVQVGNATGRSHNCPNSVSENGTFPCASYTGDYAAEEGDSGSPVFDAKGNLIGIHCSGHSSAAHKHNHFELLAGLGLDESVPLNC